MNETNDTYDAFPSMDDTYEVPSITARPPTFPLAPPLPHPLKSGDCLTVRQLIDVLSVRSEFEILKVRIYAIDGRAVFSLRGQDDKDVIAAEE